MPHVGVPFPCYYTANLVLEDQLVWLSSTLSVFGQGCAVTIYQLGMCLVYSLRKVLGHFVKYRTASNYI
jgi:hypothetical protein